MKGRLSRALWLLVTFDVLAFFGVFVLAFYGGQRAHTAASVIDFSGLNILVFAGFIVCPAASLITWIPIPNPVVAPVTQLGAFSEKLSHGDFPPKPHSDPTHDFAFIPHTP